MKIKSDKIIKVSHNNITLNKMPNISRKALIDFFMNLSNLIVDETNILTLAIHNGKRVVATNKHLETYTGYTKHTVIQNMTELVNIKALAKCKVGSVSHYVVNPEYYHYKGGVYNSVIEIFNNIEGETVLSKIKKEYKNELKTIRLNNRKNTYE